MVAISALATTSVTSVVAQGMSVLEEVLVTATKRTEGLQNVPIAISVVGGKNIEQMGVTELDELTVYLPSVHIGESASNNQIFIRGVGSGNNAGFEQSVGTFIDGVYFGRARDSRAAFLDIERVEVLKGPQSTLFGKNTVAGAINISTAQPRDEFEGYVDVGYEAELNGKSLTAMVTGPLSNSIRGRLVAKGYARDGWMENQFPGGEDGPSQDNTIFRGSLEWEVTDSLGFKVKAEHGNFKTIGGLPKETIATPSSIALNGVNDPNYANATGYNYRQSQTRGLPGRPIEDDMDNNILQLTTEYQLGEHSLRSITAYTEYEYEKCIDADYTSADLIDQCFEESHEQFTQEFLFSSPLNQTIEYLAGVYYQDAKLEFDGDLAVTWSGIPALEAGIFGFAGLPEGTPSTTLDARHLSLVEQNTESWSVFAELTWNINDRFRSTFGLRYSKDKKDIDKTDPTISFSGPSAFDSNLDAIYTAVGFFTDFAYKLDLDEEHVTGSLNFQYDINNETMAYLNLATGYKTSGFDTLNLTNSSAQFDDETVKSIELGLKMTLWNGHVRVNLAAFQGNYEDVQISSFQSAGFVVGNAAESEVTGLEGDFEVALTEHINLNGGFSALDAEYKSFPGGPCQVSDQLAGTCSSDTGGQDLSGTPLQFAPDVSANLGVSFSAPLNDRLDLNAGIDVLYSDDILVGVDNDPETVQDAYTKINARVALSSDEGIWSVALVGKNLTDELTFNWGNDTALSGQGFGFDNTYFHQLEAPRTYELQARYNF
ncbi:MAG: TonB-dependent receptor [Pseudomonadales bacterium]